MHRKIGKVLVVGAGISGVRSALDLAECGYGVVLIEKEPHMGGILGKLDRQFPNDRCGMCKMLPLVQRDASSQFCMRKGFFHENIEVLPGAELKSVEGEPGNFKVSIGQMSTGVDPARCVGCGLCSDVCPVEIPDAFNEGLCTRKAIYPPVPHAIPSPYAIDIAACNQCGECVKVCPADAIRLASKKKEAFDILVVDDELIVRDSLKELLADEGYSADMAESGAQALEMLAKKTYQLMLTDIKMPGMDGVELLNKAKEARPELCVIMMTAYATVETAVEAMKIGAREYLMKPFEPDVLIPMIDKVYAEQEAQKDLRMEVGAIVLSSGVSFFNPGEGKNVFRYGLNSNVLTNLEFERILSGTGPYGGRLLRPGDRKPVEKIAWIQCVGSRDIQKNSDFCSSVCCMIAVKQALLAKEKSPDITTDIFYMDMRAFGKSFQRYRENADKQSGVNFRRGRVHSVSDSDPHGDPCLRFMGDDGQVSDEPYDLVVLSVGQRPASQTAQLAEMLELEVNPFGFLQPSPFSLSSTNRKGVVLSGSAGEFRDISESVICASSAANEAQRVVHAAGGSLALEEEEATEPADETEQPAVLAALCSCGGRLEQAGDTEQIARELKRGNAVYETVIVDKLCSAEKWEELEEKVENSRANRLLIGACHPYAFISRLRKLGRKTGLDPSMADVVDLGFFAKPPVADAQEGAEQPPVAEDDEKENIFSLNRMVSSLRMAVADLEDRDPKAGPTVPVVQRALVVGGGIAGMHAALAIADLGFPADLVEKSEQLGGNLLWLKKTIEGLDTAELLNDTVSRVEKHPNITVHKSAKVAGAFGQAGHFFTTIEDSEGKATTIEHGVAIIATGGSEFATASYGKGESPNVISQSELEKKLSDSSVDPEKLDTVAMIQCVDSREEPRNYCSRVCCPTALKNALAMKKKNPDLNVCILYRDMMACGFTEKYFTEARKAGVMFFAFDPEKKPSVKVEGDGIATVTVQDRILGRPVAIEADLVVLASGVSPELPDGLAAAYGVKKDRDGFFEEAESKWRPVDALKEGVFACGLALSPRNIPESIASAQAAAQRALRIISRKSVAAGKNVAQVRTSLCSLCERCIEACPYDARSLNVEEDRIVVNPVMCQGCGACATVCPNDASYLEGFKPRRMFDVIDEAFYQVLP